MGKAVVPVIGDVLLGAYEFSTAKTTQGKYAAVGGMSGGAIAGVAGTALGAAATGAIAGTALGTAVPVVGNIVGFVVGIGVGIAGYYIGRSIGKKIAPDEAMIAKDGKEGFTDCDELEEYNDDLDRQAQEAGYDDFETYAQAYAEQEGYPNYEALLNAQKQEALQKRTEEERTAKGGRSTMEEIIALILMVLTAVGVMGLLKKTGIISSTDELEAKKEAAIAQDAAACAGIAKENANEPEDLMAVEGTRRTGSAINVTVEPDPIAENIEQKKQKVFTQVNTA
ncbi:MAG: hypothetical protein ACTSXQ_03615 [Alphaproteobacteria bacterium]